jgi:hypothetical protein
MICSGLPAVSCASAPRCTTAPARRRIPDLSEIQKIHAVRAVKPDHLMAEALQMPGDGDTNVAAMPGDEDAHAPMISRRSAWRMH